MKIEFYRYPFRSSVTTSFQKWIKECIPDLEDVTVTHSVATITLNSQKYTITIPPESSSGTNVFCFVGRDSNNNINLIAFSADHSNESNDTYHKYTIHMLCKDENGIFHVPDSDKDLTAEWNIGTLTFMDVAPNKLTLTKAIFRNTYVIKDLYLGVNHSCLWNVKYTDGENTFIGLGHGFFVKID